MLKSPFKIQFLIVGESAITDYQCGNYSLHVSQSRIMEDKSFTVHATHLNKCILSDTYFSGYSFGLARTLFYGVLSSDELLPRLRYLVKKQKYQSLQTDGIVFYECKK